MVEFISTNTIPEEETEEPDAEEPETEEKEESLEALVEAQTEELDVQEGEETEYVSEPVPEKGEYYHPDEVPLGEAPELKEELKPLIYDDNDVPIVADILTKYGKKENKWWLENVNVGILK